MLINKRINFLVLIWLALCVISCKKEIISFPVVNILQPVENTAYKVGDTLLVEAIVNDDNLRKVEMTLVDDNFLPVQLPINVSIGASPFQFTREFYISNLELETGRYHIRVKAWNDNNYASGFKAIHVSGIPKERLGWNIAMEDQNETQVNFYPAAGNPSLMIGYTGDFIGLETWSAKKRTSVVPRYFGEIAIIDNETK
ncbi:MAG: hypothetical protein KAG26_08745, partial [Methylococcales bacterium]|nr:hypothetical protein [Methylococcales bacterium]